MGKREMGKKACKNCGGKMEWKKISQETKRKMLGKKKKGTGSERIWEILRIYGYRQREKSQDSIWTKLERRDMELLRRGLKTETGDWRVDG
jgi:hypothetical protein